MHIYRLLTKCQMNFTYGFVAYAILGRLSRVLHTIIAYPDLLAKHAFLLAKRSIAHVVWMSEVQA